MIVWDAEGSREATFGLHGPGRCVAFSPDGTLLAGGSADRYIRLWNPATGEAAGSLVGHYFPVSCVAFSPDGSRLASGAPGLDRTVRIWDVASGALLRTYSLAADFVSFLRDGKTLMAGVEEDCVRFWSLEDNNRPSGRAGKKLKWHEGRVYSLASLPNTGQWVSAGQDGRVVVSNPASFPAEREVDHTANDFAFTSDGRGLAIAGSDGVHLVNAATAEVTATLPSDEPHWCSIAVAPDGDLLAAANLGGTICLWDLSARSRRASWSVPDHTGRFERGDLVFSPDGGSLAAVVWRETDDAVYLFDTATGQLVHAFPAKAPRAAAFSPDGTRLAMDSQNDVLVWDIAGRQILHTLRGHTNSIQAIAFSPDGRLVASGGNGRNVRLWDANAGRLRSILRGHRSEVASVAFSLDGRSLATADDGGSVKLWHVSTGRELIELIKQPTPLEKAAFSPDGKRLAYLLKSGLVRIIHVPDLQPAKPAIDD